MHTHKAKIAALLALGLVLVGCSGTDAPADPELPGGGELFVRTAVGAYQDYEEQYIVPAFQEVSPGTKVTFTGGTTAETVTKLLIEKDGVGTYDFVTITMTDIARLIDAGVLEKLDKSKISRWDTLKPNLINDYCVAQDHSPITIVYNPEAVDDAPTSWSDAFTPDVLKESGTFPNWISYIYYASAAGEAGGDPGNDWSAGYDQALEAAKSMHLYGSGDQVGQALMAGEINYNIVQRARAAQYAEQSGIDFQSVVPEEGTYEFVDYMCIPANAENKEAAYVYLNTRLDPQIQEDWAKAFYFAPSVTTAELSPELDAAINVSADEEKLIYSVDWPAIQEDLAKMRELWDKAIS